MNTRKFKNVLHKKEAWYRAKKLCIGTFLGSLYFHQIENSVGLPDLVTSRENQEFPRLFTGGFRAVKDRRPRLAAPLEPTTQELSAFAYYYLLNYFLKYTNRVMGKIKLWRRFPNLCLTCNKQEDGRCQTCHVYGVNVNCTITGCSNLIRCFISSLLN